MNNNDIRIKYIDGIRGLAAMIVLFSHIVMNFYPVLYSSSPDILSFQQPIINIIGSTPLHVFYYGFFAVMVFFIISGYVISYNVFKRNESNIASSVFRRYFRLTIPALLSCSITYLLLKTNLFFVVKAAQLSLNEPPHAFICDANFFEMIKFAFYDEYLGFDLAKLQCYNFALWMMGSLMTGSMLIYFFLAVFGRVKSSLRVILYIILIILFHRSLCLAFVLGMILCDLDMNNILQKMNKIGLSLILLVGIYLSSFRSSDFPFYSILHIDVINSHFAYAFSPLVGFIPIFYNIMGAFLLLFVINRSMFLTRIFSTKVPLYLGKISFSIYLIHAIIIGSLSSYLYILLMVSLNASYNLSFFITSAITIIATIIFSHIFYYLIELRSIQLSKSLYNLISR